MELNFNSDAKSQTIQRLFKESMEQIKSNCERGVKETELYIDKNFAGDVRSLIEDEIKSKPFTFCIVRTGNNPHTGRVEHFTGMLVGENRYYKVRYTG